MDGGDEGKWMPGRERRANGCCCHRNLIPHTGALCLADGLPYLVGPDPAHWSHLLGRWSYSPCGIERDEVVDVGPVLDLRLPGPVVVHLHRTRPNGYQGLLPPKSLFELQEEHTKEEGGGRVGWKKTEEGAEGNRTTLEIRTENQNDDRDPNGR